MNAPRSNVVLRSDLADVLRSLAQTARQFPARPAPESQAYADGFVAGIEAVAEAYGLGMPAEEKIRLLYRDIEGWYAVLPNGQVICPEYGIDGTLESAIYAAADAVVASGEDIGIEFPPVATAEMKAAADNIICTSQEIENGSWQGVDYR